MEITNQHIKTSRNSTDFKIKVNCCEGRFLEPRLDSTLVVGNGRFSRKLEEFIFCQGEIRA